MYPNDESSQAVNYSKQSNREDKTRWEKDTTGGRVKVTHRKNGYTTYHFGGMGGTVNYDKYGREC